MFLKKSEVQHLLTNNVATFEALSNNAAQLAKIMKDFAANREIFNGKAAEVVSAYLTEVHCTLLSTWVACIGCLKIRLENYLTEISEADDSNQLVIETEYVEDAAKKMKYISEEGVNIDHDAVLFANKYSQYLDHNAPPVEYLLYDLSQCMEISNTLLSNMSDVDNKFKEVDHDIERMLEGIEEACKCNTFLHLDPDTGMIKYFPGLVAEYDWLNKLAITDAVTDLLYSAFFNQDGNLNFEKIREFLNRDPKLLTDCEWTLLMKLIMDSRVTYDDICEMFYYYSVEKGYIQEMLDALSQFLTNVSFAYIEMYLAGKNIDIDTLNELLRRTQLISFISSIGTIINHGVIAYQIDTRKIDTQRLFNKGIIVFDGVEYAQQQIQSILNNASASDYRKALTDYLINEAYGKKYDWVSKITMALLDTIALTIGLYQGIAILSTIGTVLAIVSVSNDALDMIINGIMDSDKNAREKAFELNNLAAAVDLLGGRIFYVNTKHGVVITGHSFNTQKALINLTGLEKDLEISPERALAILRNPNDPSYARVYDYLTSPYKLDKKSAAGFRVSLNKTYERCWTDLIQEYPDLNPDCDASDLPLEVLQKVINLNAVGR